MKCVIVINRKEYIELLAFQNASERNKYWKHNNMDNFDVEKAQFDEINKRLIFEKCGNTCSRHCVCKPFLNKPLESISTVTIK